MITYTGDKPHTDGISCWAVITRQIRHAVRMRVAWQVFASLLLVWLVIIAYTSVNLYQTGETADKTGRQLAKALEELSLLRKQNEQLKRLANKLQLLQRTSNEYRHHRQDIYPAQEGRHNNSGTHQPSEDVNKWTQYKTECEYEPSEEREHIQRRLGSSLSELKNYVQYRLDQLLKDTETNHIALTASRISKMKLETLEYHNVLLTDLQNLSQSDGAAKWRDNESKELERIIQQRLQKLQNPSDCKKARLLVCNMNKGCGYGCQLHHLVYCFIVAYGSQRTLILDSHGWRYSPEGWEKYFQPVSDSCTREQIASDTGRTWSDTTDDVRVVDLPIIDSLHLRPSYMPQAVPDDLAPRLKRLTGRPFAWWVGQFLRYLLRPQPYLARDIAETTTRLGFKYPIVGVHVRRTDKVGLEAAFYHLEEYMKHVEEYFALLERQRGVERRRIYLASDDPTVLDEAKRKYPQYEIVSDSSFSRTASLALRYTEESLRAIIMDIHFLSLSDYLVCTFSSQVCRVAYELMQTRHPDASQRFKSLDDIYYFGGQNEHTQTAISYHTPRSNDELELNPGDSIAIAANLWNGLSRGTNKRTGKTGLYPSFKAEDHLEIVTYPETKRHDDEEQHR